MQLAQAGEGTDGNPGHEHLLVSGMPGKEG